jgi:alpha-tubulin suppressor-like RCC1 family protein
MGAGFNWDGQLGVPRKEVSKPVQVPIPEDERIIKMECGYRHSVFLTSSGKVYACGYNHDGECNTKKDNLIQTPTLMRNSKKRITNIICGGFQTILVGRMLYCMILTV